MNTRYLITIIFILMALSCSTTSTVQNNAVTVNSHHQAPAVVNQALINKYMRACSNVSQYLVNLDSRLGSIQNKEIAANINTKRSEALTIRGRALNKHLKNSCTPVDGHLKTLEGFGKSVDYFAKEAAALGRDFKTIVTRYPAEAYKKSSTIKKEYANLARKLSKTSDNIIVIINNSTAYYFEVYEQDAEIRELYKSGEL